MRSATARGARLSRAQSEARSAASAFIRLTHRGARCGYYGNCCAVNESVIVAFMLLFFLNAVITAIYFQVVPPPGL